MIFHPSPVCFTFFAQDQPGPRDPGCQEDLEREDQGDAERCQEVEGTWIFDDF